MITLCYFDNYLNQQFSSKSQREEMKVRNRGKLSRTENGREKRYLEVFVMIETVVFL